jgi:hypothetical protein
MESVNLGVGWVAVIAGLLAGALIGLFFHGEQWLGGYASWRRRMLRLAHVAMVGTGLLNILFSLSVGAMRIEPYPKLASALFVAGAATMPLVCVLAAWRRPFRHLFFVPVLSLIVAAIDLAVLGWKR